MAKRSLRTTTTTTIDSSGWLVPAGVAVIGATYGLARYGYGLTLPEFRAAFGLSTAAAGGIASGSLVAYCVAAALAAHHEAHEKCFVANSVNFPVAVEPVIRVAETTA